jgi:RNA 3'-terminal phosphate cyclase (ATP)
MANLIKIDGSHGEGGGALLRTALSMSILTQQPVQIDGNRTGTKYIGLDVEDLTLIKCLRDLCNADVSGLTHGSLSILFSPKRAIRPLRGEILTERNPNGRGSNALVIASTLVPLLARAGGMSSFSITGETHTNFSMTYDYFQGILVPIWRKMGLAVQADLERAAFSREGNGMITLEVEPSQLEGINWTEKGEPKLLQASVTTTGKNASFAERAKSHLQKLAHSSKQRIDITTFEAEGEGTMGYVAAWMRYETAIGGGGEASQKNSRPEQVAQNAFEKCFEFMTSDATVDPIGAEHILLPACFASSNTEILVSHLTSRLLTSIWVIKQFSPVRIVVRGNQDQFGQVSILRD